MASGRPDYWYAMLPGKSSLGIGQTAWYTRAFLTLAGGGEDFAVEYTVPANYKLNFEGGIISCDRPGINQHVIYKTAVSISTAYFDQCIVLPYSSGGCHILEAGDILKVFIYNLDDVEVNFYVSLFGFLEYLIV